MTQFLITHNLLGLAIGLCTFLVIGVFHPIVIKCEYYFGQQCRWWFALIGVAGVAVSLWLTDPFWSSLAGVFAFSSFWSVGEIAEQARRVARGWFPANPKRKLTADKEIFD